MNMSEYISYTKHVGKNEPKGEINQNINDFKYKSRFIPIEELILKRSPKISKEDMEQLITEIGNEDIVIDYIIKTPGGEGTDALKYNSNSVSDYHQRLMTINQRGKELFYVQTDKGQLSCKNLVMDRSYSMSDELKFRLYFRGNVDDYEKFTVVFEDEIYDQGIVKHDLVSEIKNTPKLKLTKND